MKKLVRWEKKLNKKQIAAATDFLRLFLEKNTVRKVGEKLAKNSHELVFHKAADLIRASHVPVVPGSQKEVSMQLQKIILRTPLDPVILVSTEEKLYIADGYHRICACYSVDDAIDIATIHIEV